MPFEVELEGFPGFAEETIKNKEKGAVSFRGFFSSEDGDIFIQRLEGMSNFLLSKMPDAELIDRTTINHIFAIINPNKKAKIYINEAPIYTKMRLKRGVEKGDLIYTDDIADIERVRFEDIQIPVDAGIVFLFSSGWRKGLYYDLVPLIEKQVRDYDIELHLGSLFTYLTFQERYKISEHVWAKLITNQWFPFISLKHDTIKEMLNKANNDIQVDELLKRINSELLSEVDRMLENWKKHSLFDNHIVFFEKAIEHYKAKDYLSATSILYPRIEGIMRENHYLTSSSKASQKNLTSSIINPKLSQVHSNSMLLPEKFRAYLEEVYFANFDPSKSASLSRNSIGHGTAPIEEFSLKGTLLGLLITDQIYYFLPSS